MKYCSKCGQELSDDAAFCIACGQAVDSIKVEVSLKEVEETATLANCAYVFAFLFPFVGFILGIIGVCKYKKKSYFRSKCAVAIFVSFVVTAIIFLVRYMIVNHYIL